MSADEAARELEAERNALDRAILAIDRVMLRLNEHAKGGRRFNE